MEWASRETRSQNSWQGQSGPNTLIRNIYMSVCFRSLHWARDLMHRKWGCALQRRQILNFCFRYVVCEFHNYARSDVRRITFSLDKGREACVSIIDVRGCPQGFFDSQRTTKGHGLGLTVS